MIGKVVITSTSHTQIELNEAEVGQAIREFVLRNWDTIKSGQQLLKAEMLSGMNQVDIHGCSCEGYGLYPATVTITKQEKEWKE